MPFAAQAGKFLLAIGTGVSTSSGAELPPTGQPGLLSGHSHLKLIWIETKRRNKERMSTDRIDEQQIKETMDFHGHWCPGLAIGIRAAEWALKEMGKSPDEEIVAVVETDMCGVDAIQFLTGCTFGKGNLIHKDYGKNAFTFYRRSDGKAARLVTRPSVYGDAGPLLGRLHRKKEAEGLSEEERETWKQTRAEISRRIMESDLTEVFDFKAPEGPVPRKARILGSLTCESCGEPVMETRTRRLNGQVLCIPCFENIEKR
jgi:formylmethanofuran dehydrogenase subunit E